MVSVRIAVRAAGSRFNATRQSLCVTPPALPGCHPPYRSFSLAAVCSEESRRTGGSKAMTSQSQWLLMCMILVLLNSIVRSMFYGVLFVGHYICYPARDLTQVDIPPGCTLVISK